MARYIRYGGLASILVVNDDHEIDALMDHPDLDRIFTSSGPLLNRAILAHAQRGVALSGDVLLSFRPRDFAGRADAQRALRERLDALAAVRPWPRAAIAPIAHYVATGTGRDMALAALTYVTACPFLARGSNVETPSFDADRFARLFRLYARLNTARRLWAGLPLRLLGMDRQAAQRIRQATNGDDYALHAIGITLANSVLILDRLRARFAAAGSIDWSESRTAPALIVRQTTKPCRLLDMPAQLPQGTLVLLHMRRALRADSRAGFEFATSHWAACPASSYIPSVFAAVSAHLDAEKNAPSSASPQGVGSTAL